MGIGRTAHDESRKNLAKINATNAEIIVSARDLQMHIDKLKSAPLGQNEAKNASVEDLAEHIKKLAEKKK